MLEEPPGGLVLVRDSAACEGRSVLRALVTAAASRGERVLVLLLDAPREPLERGMSPELAPRLEFRDLSRDPLGWMGGGACAPGGGACALEGGACSPGEGLLERLLGGLPGAPPPQTLVLDSLSWLLLRLPPPRVLRALGGLLRPPRGSPPRVLALLHEDLHPPALLRALGGGASSQLLLRAPPAPPRVARVITRPPRAKDETFILLPDGSLGPPLERPPARTPGSPGDDEGGAPPPAARTPGSRGDVTFRLALSAAERAARAALTPPFRIGPHSPATPDSDPDDPDNDLDV